MSEFNCHSCGACCMVLDKILSYPDKRIPDEYREEIKNFPYKANKNGWCEKLGADLKCTIYEKRPPLCRIDDHFKKHKRCATKKEYYAETTEACKALMKSELGMSEKEIETTYATLP